MQNLQEDIREAMDCLAVAIKSIRADDGIDADERAELIEESQRQFKKHVNALVMADLQKRAAEIKITKDEPPMPTRAELYADLKKGAIAQRRAGETNEGALARWIGTPEGRKAFDEYKNAPGNDAAIAAPVTPAPVIKLDGAYGQLRRIAAEMQKADASLTRPQAIAKIVANPRHRELWERAKQEQAFA